MQKTNNKLFLNVSDVCSYMSISKPKGYQVIRQLNNELNDKGYLTIAGKVSKAYFLSKVFIDSNALSKEDENACL